MLSLQTGPTAIYRCYDEALAYTNPQEACKMATADNRSIVCVLWQQAFCVATSARILTDPVNLLFGFCRLGSTPTQTTSSVEHGGTMVSTLRPRLMKRADMLTSALSPLLRNNFVFRRQLDGTMGSAGPLRDCAKSRPRKVLRGESANSVPYCTAEPYLPPFPH
jgi:hypothetical protein